MPQKGQQNQFLLVQRSSDFLGNFFHVESFQLGKRPRHVQEWQHLRISDANLEAPLARLWLHMESGKISQFQSPFSLRYPSLSRPLCNELGDSDSSCLPLGLWSNLNDQGLNRLLCFRRALGFRVSSRRGFVRTFSGLIITVFPGCDALRADSSLFALRQEHPRR